MKLLHKYCVSVFPFMKMIVLCCFILATYFNEGLSHVGEKCTMFLFCSTKNSYCDTHGICRCRQDYPVNVTAHDCRRGRRYGSRCDYNEECRYYDKNSYCTQTPYRSVCDCNLDLIYDERKKLCVKGPSATKNSQGALLPIILGASLGVASMLCCCLAAWHCCQSHRQGEETVFRRLTLRIRNSGRNSSENNRGRTQVPSNDVLPPYEMIVKENQNDELPPSYEDVMKQAKLQEKSMAFV